MFITLEGIEGCGKSTQAELLCKYLSDKSISVIRTREPCGGPLGNTIKDIILKGNGVDDATTEYLLLTAARREHVQKLIIPALENGTWVISDRFFDSSIAYQGYCKNLDINVIKQIKELAIGKIDPDITFLLDMDPNKATKRISMREGQERNHYDNMSYSLHNIIREGFLTEYSQNQNRIKKIQADAQPQEVLMEIVNILKTITNDSRLS